MKYSQENTMYIYTSVEQDSQINEANHIICKARTNVKTQSSPVSTMILFNSNLVSTFYKITGVVITNNGGMSNIEISTVLRTATSDKEVIIGGISTSSNHKEVNCSALNPDCSD